MENKISLSLSKGLKKRMEDIDTKRKNIIKKNEKQFSKGLKRQLKSLTKEFILLQKELNDITICSTCGREMFNEANICISCLDNDFAINLPKEEI